MPPFSPYWVLVYVHLSKIACLYLRLSPSVISLARCLFNLFLYSASHNTSLHVLSLFSHRSGALDIRLVTRDSFSRAVSNCLIDSKKKSSCLNIVKISKVGEATSANCPVRVTLQALYKFAGGNSSHAIEMRGDMAQVRGLLMPIVSSCLSVLSSSHISISASTCL